MTGMVDRCEDEPKRPKRASGQMRTYIEMKLLGN